jgi:hypothetical protein
MTRPLRTILWMLFFLSGAAVASAAIPGALAAAFMASPVLNGLIVGVFVAGVAVSFYQVLRLQPEVSWIEGFRGPEESASAPRLLAPIVRMLKAEDGDPSKLTGTLLRSLLDDVRAHLAHSRDIARYLMGLLVFLGVLGTSWGLLTTVQAAREIVGGLSFDPAGNLIFPGRLKQALSQPLEAMGTAFSSTIFGLTSALILGFLHLQAAQAQTRFLSELREWLSGVARLPSGPVAPDADGGTPAYVSALLEQTAEGLDRLQRTLADHEEERHHVTDKLFDLTEQIARLTDQMGAEMRLFESLAESQARLAPVLHRLADGSAGALDEASRAHLRNLDVGITRLAEDATAGRERLLRELRDELRLLCRTVAASTEARGVRAAVR